jgi:hypothetical protein
MKTEKAKELVALMNNSIYDYNVEWETSSKQCALIAVDEIIRTLHDNTDMVYLKQYINCQ